MKAIIIIFLFIFISKQAHSQSFGEYPAFTDWYENPLGFYPLNLHTSSGIILPAVAAAACLIFTKHDTSLTNRISFYSEGGISKGYYLPKTTMYQHNIGFFYHARNWLHLGAEFNVYHPSDAFNNTWGFGIRPMVRFLPINKENYRLFFESGAGLIYFLHEFPQPTSGYGEFNEPRTGTKWNGSPKYGIGAEINFDKRFSVLFGARHVHISNGDTKGKERNPGHDSNGFYLGFSYKPIKN